MTARPVGTRGGGRNPAPSTRAGAVLRGVHVQDDRRELARPERDRPRGTGAPAKGVATPPRLDAADERSYEDGVRAGRTEAEGAHRAALAAALETARAQGFQRGLAEGLEAGRTEALDVARQEAERTRQSAADAVAERTAQLDAVLVAWDRERSARLAAAEDDMVALCHAVICRILGDRLVTAEGIARLVREAVREHSVTGGLERSDTRGTAIHLHPRDLERLHRDEHVAAWVEQRGRSGGSRLNWIPDEQVGPGGCIVRSAEGSLDARIERQLAVLRRLLTQGRAPDPSGIAGPADSASGSERR